MDRDGLYRPEALARAGGPTHGQPVDLGLRTLRRLCAGLALACVLLVALMSQLPYARRLQVSGVITQAAEKLVAPRAGVLAEVFMHDGQHARQGQPLFRISTEQQLGERSTVTGSTADALERRESIVGEQRNVVESSYQQKLASLLAQRDSTERERVELESQLRLQDDRVEIALTQQSKDEELIAEGFISRAALYSRRDTVLDFRQHQSELRRSLAANKKDYQSLEQAIAELESSHRQSRLTVADNLEVLRTEKAVNEGRKGVLVTASMDGDIDGVGLLAGDYVTEGQTLANLSPVHATKARVQLFVPSSASASTRAGMAVAISVRAFPYQKFGLLHGKIVSVARVGVSGRELAQLPIRLEPEQIYFRVVVELEEHSLPDLAAGMAVDGRIRLEERTLLGWIAESVTGYRNE